MQPTPPEQEEWPLEEWFQLRDAWLALSAKVLILLAGLLAVAFAVGAGQVVPEQGLWGAVVAAAAVLMWGQMTGALSQVFLRQGYHRLSTRLDVGGRRGVILGTQALVGAVVATVLSAPVVFGWVEVSQSLVVAGAGAVFGGHLLYAALLSWALERYRHAVLPPLLGPPLPPSPAGWIAGLEAGADEG